MLKSTTAVVVAATIATVCTILSAPSVQVAAGPLPEVSAAPIRSCTERPWPYFGCVGTPYGAPHVRLVSIERLSD